MIHTLNSNSKREGGGGQIQSHDYREGGMAFFIMGFGLIYYYL